MADMVIDFSPILAQLSSEVLLEELRRRLGAGGSSGDPTAAPQAAANSTGRDPALSGQIRADEFFRLSGSEAIRKYLAIMKRPQSPRAIVEGLRVGGVLSNAKNFYANVWTELKRARERGEIVNTPSGWGLAEWYPNKPKQPEPIKPIRKGRKKSNAKKARTSKAASAPASKASEDQTKGSVMTYSQFLSEWFKAKKPKKDMGIAWKKYKESVS